MDTDLDRARKDALAFITRHKTGVLATVSETGDAHSSPRSLMKHFSAASSPKGSS
ncbi:MAG: pyridoxamine 5'-phosphate oxidase family protein [Candidatus Adlerbacteria bacterium]|nr:pyridoxamine 5'-phosphate oxidase family protein [Candidatus Adlerbacteria bacterium]